MAEESERRRRVAEEARERLRDAQVVCANACAAARRWAEEQERQRWADAEAERRRQEWEERRRAEEREQTRKERELRAWRRLAEEEAEWAAECEWFHGQQALDAQEEAADAAAANALFEEKANDWVAILEQDAGAHLVDLAEDPRFLQEYFDLHRELQHFLEPCRKLLLRCLLPLRLRCLFPFFACPGRNDCTGDLLTWRVAGRNDCTGDLHRGAAAML
jgi:hypothetical protein